MSAAGTLAEEHYASQMAPWRFKLRSALVEFITPETAILARLQRAVRGPTLDTYFAVTANIGSHTFYMVMLPVFFWFGNPELGTDVIWVLALGVYMTGVAKDLLCLPRPLSPPLHRISMSGSALLEYGFPSTHSSNAVAVSLIFREWYPSWPMTLVNLWLVITLVSGRIYTGMHGFLDVAVGALFGALAWWLRVAVIRGWTDHMTRLGALLFNFIALLLVSSVPEPVDDCPCFDDSVAFLGVLMGFTWTQKAIQGFPPLVGESWVIISIKVLGRFTLGVGCVVLWRMVSKRVLLRILPPIWRLFQRLGVEHPRKYFISASEYKTLDHRKVPDESLPDSPSQIADTLRRVRRSRGRSDSVGPQSAADVYAAAAAGQAVPSGLSAITKPRVRYDIEVVMRLIVYGGIPIVAINLASVLFIYLNV